MKSLTQDQINNLCNVVIDSMDMAGIESHGQYAIFDNCCRDTLHYFKKELKAKIRKLK